MLSPDLTDILCENYLLDVTQQQPLASTHIKLNNYTTTRTRLQYVFYIVFVEVLLCFGFYFIHIIQKSHILRSIWYFLGSFFIILKL